MATSTVTQDRAPQKVGETLQSFGEGGQSNQPRSCVKTRMIHRDCDEVKSFSSSVYSREIMVNFKS